MNAMRPFRQVAPQNDGSVIVYITPPPFMHLPRVSVHLTVDQYARYVEWMLRGGRIQKLLSDLSDDEREKLISGISGKDFDRMFKEG